MENSNNPIIPYCEGQQHEGCCYMLEVNSSDDPVIIFDLSPRVGNITSSALIRKVQEVHCQSGETFCILDLNIQRLALGSIRSFLMQEV